MNTLEGYSLSSQQKRIWDLQTTFNSLLYNYLSMKIEGNLSIPELTNCFLNVINQHEILRSSFQDFDGIDYPIQIISEKAMAGFSYSENTSSEEDNQQNPKEIVTNKLQMERGKTIQIELKKVNDHEYKLDLYGIALCTDFKSLQLIVKQVFELYTSKNTVPQQEIIQYVDFSQWQNDLFENEHLISYEKFQLSKNVLPYEMLTESSTESDQQSLRLKVSKKLSGKIKELAKQHNTSISTVFYTGWKAFLSKVACHDIQVGMVIDGRTYEELKQSIGQFEKVVPIQAKYDQGTFIEYNDIIQNEITGLMENVEYLNLSNLLESPENYIPYQFRFLDHEPAKQEEIKLKIIDLVTEDEKYKLLLSVLPAKEDFELFLQFNACMFSEIDAEKLFSQYLYFLEQCVDRHSEQVASISYLSKEEDENLFNRLNHESYLTHGLDSFQSNRNVIEYIEDKVQANGELLAIIDGAQSITYQELNKKANQLARYLHRFLQPEDRVVLCLPRSVEAIISMLAVLKTGASFVPVDIKWPINRINYVVGDSGAKLLISNQQNLLSELKELAVKCVDLEEESELIKEQDESSPYTPLAPQQLAYVLYTSGSTGLPKGVGIQHGSLLNYLEWFDQQFLNERIRLPFISELGFDAFLKQVFYPLMIGEQITLFSEDEILNPQRFIRGFLDKQLNALNCVPSLWASIIVEIQKDEELAASLRNQLRVLFVGGEKISTSLLIRTWDLFPHLQVVNLYGPTEITSNATFAIVKNERFVPIGSPVKNAEAYVLDEEMKRTSAGEIGELYIGGTGLARGYLGKTAQTAAHFVPHPFSKLPGKRLYKTGDHVRLMANGQLEFIGRVDEQIKVNGKRVDLNEIEAVIMQHPGVKDAVVLSIDNSQGLSLIAFCVPSVEISDDELKAFSRKWLPQYMVPVKFISLTEIPLNANGKTDKRALCDLYEQFKEETYVAPRNDFEEVIAGIWKGVLKRKQVGITDNFFELGGHSLNATQIISRIRKIYQLEIPVSLLFETETTEKLCAEMYSFYPEQIEYISMVSKAYLEAQKMANEESMQKQ
ncbi:amino acid adenylation domain-containing protein [Metabacillus arenae]|uniref:Amino acid adenylation domain-containing protein n=1 Tax=Metabacillus arenae TaxID=2771434 RepID=A0A926RVA7_9BACI|nr:non-ribosomal peptide synthetase [Metabacillus arenae]MBD1379488.1 amino acid adenylation domain-containing protein [Metabacillus arenae]